MQLSIDYLLRPYREADAPQVVDMVNAEGSQSLGLTRAALDSFGQVRLMRYVPGASPKVVAVTHQGQVIGYAYVADREQHIVYEMGGAVHPDYWGQGVGDEILKWGQQQAEAMSQCVPPDIKVVLQTNLFEGEDRARRLFIHSGFAQAREWLHFELQLHASPPVIVIPPGIEVHPIDLDNDWDRIGPAMDDAFADHWGVIVTPLPEVVLPDSPPTIEMPEDESFSNAPGFCFMALAGDEVAGGILCNAKLVERGDTGRIGSIFVRPAYRRQGVGRALMLSAFNAFWQAGFRRVILDTDADSFTHAPQFYTQLGMRVYRREFLYEKEIRPGQEVRQMTPPVTSTTKR